MAKLEQVLLIDDIDGGQAHETVYFGLGGDVYEIDLHEDKAAALRAALAEFVNKARKVVRSKTKPISRARVPSTSRDTESPKKQRDWLRANGYVFGERGRLSKELKEAYRTRTPNPAPVDPMAKFRPTDDDDDEAVKAKFFAWCLEVKGKNPVGPNRSLTGSWARQWTAWVKD